MRKLICWMLLLMLLTIPALAEDVQADVAGDGDVAYLLRDNSLWTLDAQCQPEAQICAFEQEVRDIFAADGQLYIAYRDDAGVTFAKWSEQAVEPLFTVAGESDVYDFCISGDSLAVMWYGLESDFQLPADLYRFGLYSLDGARRPATLEFVSAMSPYAEGGLLVGISDVESTIYTMDAATGEGTVLYDFMSEVPLYYGIYGLAGTPEQLYYADFTGLHMVDETGSAQTLLMQDIVSHSALTMRGTAVIGYSAWYAAADGDAVLFAYDPVLEASKRQLTIIHGGNTGMMDDQMKRALAKFYAEHPDVRVNFEDLPDEQLNTILLAGGEGADIVAVSIGDRAIIESGALVNLRDCPAMMTQLEPLEYLLPMVSHGDMVYGVPFWITADAIYTMESLKAFDTTGLDLFNCSWQEFFDAAMAFDGDTDGDGEPNIAFYSEFTNRPAWVGQYVASFGSMAEVTFDTPLFCEMMTAYREAKDAKKIIDVIEDGDEFGWEEQLYSRASMEGPYMYGDANAPLPTLDGQVVRTATSTALGVNARSEMREEALRLLEIYLMPEIVFADWGMDLRRTDAAEYIDRSQYTDSEWAKYERESGYFRDLTPDLAGSSAEVNVMLGELLKQYYADEISLDTLIDQLDAGLAMRLQG